jgi:hypothetical protein
MIDDLLVAAGPKKAQFPVMIVSIVALIAIVWLAIFLA